MLYIQHQYEETYYEASDDWQFELAALQGSSYLRLPRALAWAVGNANYHHVHHLSAKIPNYRLPAAHAERAMFERTPVVTLRSSVAALRLKLWDEEHGCLVRFPPGRARFGAAAQAVANPGLVRADARLP
jgi:omega-6 fatty acid desaturase (delta-12 desaturase)